MNSYPWPAMIFLLGCRALYVCSTIFILLHSLVEVINFSHSYSPTLHSFICMKFVLALTFTLLEVRRSRLQWKAFLTWDISFGLFLFCLCHLQLSFCLDNETLANWYTHQMLITKTALIYIEPPVNDVRKQLQRATDTAVCYSVNIFLELYNFSCLEQCYSSLGSYTALLLYL